MNFRTVPVSQSTGLFFFVTLLSATLSVGRPLFAQEQQPPVFRVGVEAVAVDVTVVDKEGELVRDLNVDDFLLLVDGEPRPITSVDFISQIETRRSQTPAQETVTFATNVGARPGRLVLLVVDQGSISFGGGRAVMASATRFIDTLLPEDRIGLFTMPPGGPRVELTSDHSRVKQALAGVAGQPDEPIVNYNIGLVEALDIYRKNKQVTSEVIARECANAPGDPACPTLIEFEARDIANEAYRRTRQSINAFRDVMRSLQSIEGPKTLILVSEGLIFNSETQGDFLQLSRDAAKARAVFHTLQIEAPPIDASRRFASPTQMQDIDLRAGGLDTIANTTRGARFRVVGSGESAFDRIERELAGYYLLGFEVRDSDRDHKPHRIEVRIARRTGLSIRSRAEFILPEDSGPRPPADQLAEALRSPFLTTELPLKLATYNLYADERDQVRVLITAELGESVGLDRADVAFVLIDEDENVKARRSGTFTAPARDDKADFKIVTSTVVPPGRYRLKLATFDDRGRLASVEHRVEAKFSGSEDIGLSDLVLSNPTLEGSNVPILSDLATGDALKAYLEIDTKAGKPLGQAEATLEVAEAADAPALTSARMSMAEQKAGRWVAEGRVALGRLPSGDYVARVHLSQRGNKAATVWRRFRFFSGGDRSGPTGEYLETIDSYKNGNYTAARRNLSRMDPDALDEAFDSFASSEPTEVQLKAAALVHTEIVLRSEKWEVSHVERVRALMSRIANQAHRRAFERQWFLMVGRYFQVLNRDSEAVFIFEAALDSFPDDTEMLLAAGAVYEANAWMWGSSEPLERARKHLQRVLKKNPGNTTAHLRLGHVLKLQLNRKEALEKLQWTLEHSDASEERLPAYLILGDVHRAQKDFTSAIECYRAALDIDPGCRAVATSLSHALHKARDFVGARAVLERFFESEDSRLGNSDSWWRYLRGDRSLVQSMMTALQKEVH